MTRWLWLSYLLLLAGAPAARAHVGPPYAILVDRPCGPCTLSVWADPDVGTGTFFLMPEAPDGQAIPDDLTFEVWVQPADRRLPLRRYGAERRNHVQYFAEVDFPTEELWRVRIVAKSAAGVGDVESEVQVTPPGFGRWDLLIYAVPVMLLASLWVALMLRRKPRRRAGPPAAAGPLS